MKVNFCIVLLALFAVTHGRPQGTTEDVTTELSNVAPVPQTEDENLYAPPPTVSVPARTTTTTTTVTKATEPSKDTRNAPVPQTEDENIYAPPPTTSVPARTTTTKATEPSKDTRNARRRAFLSRNGGTKHTNVNELDTMINTMKRDGDKYNYKYDTRNGNTHEENGRVVNKGTDDQMVVVRGGYKHTSDDGYTYDIRYIADERGFRPIILVHRPNE